MWFGELPTSQAQGCILAHSVRVGSRRIGKGKLLTASLVDELVAGGCLQVTVAKLDRFDVHENEAAAKLAVAVAGKGVTTDKAHTGRVNLYASQDGLLCVDRASICAINAVDESITLATLAENSWVLAGKMIATSKIISYAVDADDFDRAESIARLNKLSVLAPKQHRAVLMQTTLPSIKESTLDKTRIVTEQRLQVRRAELVSELRCTHAVDALQKELSQALHHNPDWILIAGASAISDRRDVIPAAIEGIGGRVHRFGIPVDPGNLLLLGECSGTVVIGMPGCARSPKYNGIDQLLDRLACGVDITDPWLNSLAVGGLLTEMVDRPQPRVINSAHTASRRDSEVAVNYKRKPIIAGLVLAAGSSRRAGSINKLLQPYQGLPMVKSVVNALKASKVDQVVVVTGYEHDKIEQVIKDTDVTSHYCASHNMGLAHSLSLGISRLEEVDAVLVCLGDMPHITSALIDELIDHVGEDVCGEIAVPVVRGENGSPARRGNPVVVGKAFFDTLLQHSGDSGAKFLMRQYPEKIVEIDVDDNSVLLDYDTPEALATLR